MKVNNAEETTGFVLEDSTASMHGAQYPIVPIDS